MPIRKRILRNNCVPITSSGFPFGYSFPTCLPINKPKLIWAALTIGKPGLSHLTRRGRFSLYEVLNRASLVLMNVDFRSRSSWPYLALSPVFHDLDPSEKGMVSYYLGMMVTKLCAHELLDTPWLVHLNWMESRGRLSDLSKSRSRADLLGLSRQTGIWSLFEAKGRSGSFTRDVIDNAKNQACMNIRIDGVPKDLGIACALFTKGHFDFHWRDPISSEEKPIDLKTTRETWSAYYGSAIALLEFQKELPEETMRLFGFRIDIHPVVMKFIESLDDTESELWRNLLPEIGAHITKPEGREDTGVFMGLDGITVRLAKEMLE